MKWKLKSSLENGWCMKLKERRSTIIEEAGPSEGIGLEQNAIYLPSPL